jgi:predicted dehydrogenase
MIDSAVVIGCGSIGRRHLRNLQRLGVARLVAADAVGDRAKAVANELGIFKADSIEQALSERPRAVVVAVPPHLHLTMAQAAIRATADVFIEKPISHSLEGVDDLIGCAAAAERFVAVGYNLRCHAAVIRMKAIVDEGSIGPVLMMRAEFGQYLPDWRPNQDYRAGYNARKEMGGGIILDASHEIDYVTWIGGRAVSVFCAAARLSTLDIAVEDAAVLTLRLAHGAIAEIHLDSIQRSYSRTCKIIGEQGTILWDYSSGLRVLRPGKPAEDIAIVPDPNDMYLEEMRHFLACVRRDESPMVDAAVGAEVLKVALGARRSAERVSVVDFL